MKNLKFKDQNVRLWISLILVFTFWIFHYGLTQAETGQRNIPQRLIGYSQVGSWTRDGWDYKRFLDILSEYRLNYTRIFGIVPWFDGVMPWPKEKDGRYNLTRFDDKYWERLRDYVRYANSKGIIVHFTLFDRCGMTDRDGWERHPFNPSNNNNDIRAVRGWHVWTSDQFKEVQRSYVIRAARELRGRDVIFEVANEPFDRDEWHRWVIDILRREEIREISINIERFRDGYNWISFHIKRLPVVIEGRNFIYSDDGMELKDPDTIYRWAKEILDNDGSYEHLSAENDVRGSMPPVDELNALLRAKSEGEDRSERE